jgi:hypothetical protein
MITVALVSSIKDFAHCSPKLEDIILAQHDSRINFSADWSDARKSMAYSILGKRDVSTKDIYKRLGKMGWKITSLDCIDVLFNK